MGNTAASSMASVNFKASGQSRISSRLIQRGRCAARRSAVTACSSVSSSVCAARLRRRVASKRCRLAGWSAHSASRNSATERGRLAGSVLSAQSMARRKALP